MNDLSNLLFQNFKLNYKIDILCSPEEYELIMFSLEEKERLFERNTPPFRALVSLKEKLIKNHNLFNNTGEIQNASQDNRSNKD